MNWVDLDGISLRYQLSGGDVGSEGLTVVLVHEMGGSLESWDEVLPLLPEAVSVVRYDLRGCGISEKIVGDVTIEELACDIARLLDRLGRNDPVVVAGCAIGATVAIGFAALFPERCAGIVAMCPAMGVQAELKEERLKGVAKVERDGQRSISEAMLGVAYPQRLRDRDPARFEAYRARWISADPHGFAAQSRMLFDLTFDDYLSDIRCPALIVSGTWDSLRPPAYVAELAGHVPGSTHMEADSGHFMNAESPDIVAGLISGFLGDNQLI